MVSGAPVTSAGSWRISVVEFSSAAEGSGQGVVTSGSFVFIGLPNSAAAGATLVILCLVARESCFPPSLS